MKIKRILAVTLACALMFTMAFALTGCGGDEKVLKVGVKDDVIGFGLKDEATEEYSGMEIDLAKLIAEELGYDDVEFTAVTAQTRGELLDDGSLDCVIATFTIRPERKELWDFSTPYFTDAVTVLVENSSGITSLEDLVGKTIGVATASTSALALVTAMAAEGLFPDYEVPEADSFVIAAFSELDTKFTEFPNYPAISTALSGGTVDAFCVDGSILAKYKDENRSYIDAKFAPQDYGVATKKGAELSAQIDELIVKWLADGTIDGLINEHNIG